MGVLLFFVFRFSPQPAILNSMRLAPIASILMTCLTLNAQTIQGKVVRVADGDTITILDEAKVQHKVRLNRIDAPEKVHAFGEMEMKLLPQFYSTNEVSPYVPTASIFSPHDF